MIQKNDNLYDIYIYNSKYTNIFGPYLLHLKNNLLKKYIKMYNSKIIKETCIYKEELVELVKIISNEFIFIYIY